MKRKAKKKTVPLRCPIVAERRRQTEAEGYDAAHDDRHILGELGRAAAVYYAVARELYSAGSTAVASYWPFEIQSFNPYNSRGITDKRKCLIRAGALAMAERDRLDRLIEEIRQDLKP